ncbi:MAG: calcium/proton exchanger [Cyanobacteria bacterium P01_H01_bin.119]
MSVKNIIFIGLLVFVPISIAAYFLNWGELTVFITAGLAILPLAGWMGIATEEIAVVLGPSWGGLLNATFGNATELIIALIALNEGLINVVKASITGSIIGNLLLVMGLAMLLGGLRHKEQVFQPVVARVNASSMNLAVIAILLPTAVDITSNGIDEPTQQKLSIAVALVLILVYGLTLLFSMKTHTYLYDAGVANAADAEISAADVSAIKGAKAEAIAPDPKAIASEQAPKPIPAQTSTQTPELTKDVHHHELDSDHKPNLSLWIGVLLAATATVAAESELLVNALEVATEELGLTRLFTGVILLPIIGNAAEHATAVTVAIKNKMDLALSVAVGSSLQIAMFVAPVLVIAGWFLGQPMDLDFNSFELVAVAVAVLIANSISSDGRSNWLEGTLLVAAYAVLALAFYFHPIVDGIG